ncbi:MAG TPA: DUF6351 family protein [Mycobacteriales bacterium]|nr:DUF6351 family protein [Mycobacteriales bacterium]
MKLVLVVGCLVAVATPAVAPATPLSGPAAPRILVLSSRPAWVSGPDALVAVVVPTSAELAHLTVRLDGSSVGDELRTGRLGALLAGLPDPQHLGLSRSDHALIGLVSLRAGDHTLTASVPGLPPVTRSLTDYPDSGPMFAGPQVTPWICNDGSTSADCAMPATYRYYYLPLTAAGAGNQPTVASPPSSDQFLPYDVAHPPLAATVARTTTDEGVSVPFVVRVETGVIDRDTYQVAVLAAPGRSTAPWHAFAAWDHKLDIEVGGDCRPWHDQAAGLPVFDAHALARGYAVATGGLETLGDSCNPVVAAEAIAMLETHIVDEYGLIRYTIGEGCSGGSIVLNAVASNYPGLVNGLLLMCSFPDVWQVAQQAEDCHLLDRVFDQHPLQWSTIAQDDVTGFLSPTTCRGFFDGPQGSVSARVPDYAQSLFDPAVAADCTAEHDPGWVYDASTNPAGTRCTLQDYQVAIWGRRPRAVWSAAERRIGHGFANRPFDNVGVQYGLEALDRHQISITQFLSLNREVGGLDIDWNHTRSRSVADHHALVVAYRTGQVLDPHAESRVPIFDIRGHDNEEIHLDIDSYVERARLQAATGSHRNEVLWFDLGEYAVDPTITARAFDRLDAWLGAVERDESGRTLRAKVAADRPAGVVDECWLAERPVTSGAECRRLFVHGTDPRIAAGGPLQDNVLKCRLIAPRRADYAVRFSKAQWRQLRAIFPGGVCNDQVPGVGARASMTWPTFGGARLARNDTAPSG